MDANKTRKMSGLPITIEAIGDTIAALHMAREMTATYTNATSARPGVKIEGAEELQERYAVAIRSLGQHLLERLESLYEPEERAYTFHGHEEVPATWKFKAKSEEEAKEKFRRFTGDGASWYSIEEGAVDPEETYADAETEEV